MNEVKGFSKNTDTHRAGGGFDELITLIAGRCAPVVTRADEVPPCGLQAQQAVSCCCG